MKGLQWNRFGTDDFSSVSDVEDKLAQNWGRYVAENSLDYEGSLQDFRVDHERAPYTFNGSNQRKLYVRSDNMTVVFGKDLKEFVENIGESIAHAASYFSDDIPERGNDPSMSARTYDRNLNAEPETEQDKFLASFMYNNFESTSSNADSIWKESKNRWETFLEEPRIS